MKKKIGEILLQIIPVMIGVYLGFVMSSWADTNKRKKESAKMVENIISEIASNQKKIEAVVEYHMMIRDSSRHYAYNTDKIGNPQFFQGTRIIPLTNSAFETGIQTGIINELSLEQIQALNQLYTYQNEYNNFSNILMSGLINKKLSDKEEHIRDIALYLAPTMTDVVIKEEGLLKEYGMVKSLLKQ
ncbi:MAG: hypothetical protein AAGC88_17315 [Bacteroidota bacterium]